MKKILLSITGFFIALFLIAPHAEALGKNYIYRSRAQWVKLEKLTKKELAGQSLSHPTSQITSDQMEAMLMTLQMQKGTLFKKELNTTQIFNDLEAKRFAPYIVQALNQATPQEVVNVSVIHKRPYFILRNDYVSNISIFLTDQGLHFYFNKLFARLDGDYQQASNIDEALKDAKSIRVDLSAGPGQKLTMNDGKEIVLDTGFDFASGVAQIKQEQAQEDADALKAKSERKSKKNKKQDSTATAESTATTDSSDITERLKKLEELKKQKLVTESEYQAKKKEILGGL